MIPGNFNEHDQPHPDAGYSSNGGRDSSSLPLGVGEAEVDSDLDLEALSRPSRRPRFNSGAMIITIVLLVAAAGLYSMRTITRVSAGVGTDGVESTIDLFLSMMHSEGGDDSPQSGPAAEGAILDVLTESYTDRQVSLSHVQRDPFVIFEEQQIKPEGRSAPERDPLEVQQEQRRAEFERAGGRLTLRSVMLGNRPLASINNQVFAIGDRVPADDVEFRVQSIKAGRVTLLAEDEEIGVTVETVLTLK